MAGSDTTLTGMSSDKLSGACRWDRRSGLRSHLQKVQVHVEILIISFVQGLQIAFSLVNVMVPAKLVIKSTRTLLVVVGVIVVMDAGSQVQMCQMVRWFKLKES